MPKSNLSLSVPADMKVRYDEIATLINQYCSQKLNEEYAQLSKSATAMLCRKKPSPLVTGSAATWACGIIYAIGFVNFLQDKSSSPYVRATELAGAFGIAQSTAGNKSKQIRELLKMRQFDHRWTLPSRIANTPMIWMITVNGFIVDARQLSRDIQEVAYKKGLIPYIYADQE
jgi:Domain of unknown function (DUF6398)